MKLAELEPVLTQWDRVRGAIQNLLVAQPAAMSARAEQLDAERLAMEQVFRNLTLELPAKHTLAPEGTAAPTLLRTCGKRSAPR